MRKFLLLILLLCSCSTYAQTSVNFGIKTGGSLNFIHENLPPSIYTPIPYYIINLPKLINGKLGMGSYSGVFMEICPKNPNNKFKLEIELLYTRLSVKYEKHSEETFTNEYVTANFDTLNKVDFRLQQLCLPILAEYYITPKLSVHLGPTLNYIIKGGRASYDSISETANYADGSPTAITFSEGAMHYGIPHKLHAGFVAGAKYNFFKGLSMDVDYNQILGKLKNRDVIFKQTVHSIQFGLGYTF